MINEHVDDKICNHGTLVTMATGGLMDFFSFFHTLQGVFLFQNKIKTRKRLDDV